MADPRRTRVRDSVRLERTQKRKKSKKVCKNLDMGEDPNKPGHGLIKKVCRTPAEWKKRGYKQRAN